jgi:hypothetical protein
MRALLILLIVGLSVPVLADGAGATGTAVACNESGVETALAAGGDYTIDCDSTYIQFMSVPLTSSKVTTFTNTGNADAGWYDYFSPGDKTTFHRFINVTGGSLTLTGIDLNAGRYVGSSGSGGTPGVDGTNGGASQSGTPAGAGGGPGGDAPPAQGGQVYISSGATLTLNGGLSEGSILFGGAGGAGGGGGAGGAGGTGTFGTTNPGGSGEDGSSGGGGGTGGAAQGGAIYVAQGGTLNVNQGTVFEGDTAYSGQGGAGGGGGRGGGGGSGGSDGNGGMGPGGSGGNGAIGGVGGKGGQAQGGAIYNAGTLNISSARFTGDRADGTSQNANGGNGGNGGTGGTGGLGNSFGSGGNGTNGSTGGTGGDSQGGAIYNAGTMTLGQVTFGADNSYPGDATVAGNGGSGGVGGAGGCPDGCYGGSSYGTNGNGGNGGNGGNARDASVYSTGTITGCATISDSTVQAGGGGSGAFGGYQPTNSTQGTTGANGQSGSTGEIDPTISGGSACPTLSVADASASEPSGSNATLTFTISLSAAAQSATTVGYTTGDGTATAGTDYDSASGTATIPAGQTTATVPVTIHDVGFEADKTLTLTLSNPSPVKVTLARSTATGTIHGRSPLEVTVDVAKTPIVQQTAGGFTPLTTSATVTLKNVGTKPLTDVTLPSDLTIGWHAPASGTTRPVIEAAAPKTLDLGGLAPGASTTPATYTLQVSGDGSLDMQALATAGLDGGTIKGLGTTVFTPDSQLLVFTAKVGAKVNSQTNPGLIQAGTSFLVNLKLENRSNYRTIVVDPIYPGLAGNASDGAVLPANVGYTGSDPTGAISEVEGSPYIALKPGETANYLVVVRTGASDAADPQTAAGGTRASVKFDPPGGHILNTDNTAPEFDPGKYTVLTAGSDDLEVGIDDHGMTAAPWALSSPTTWLEATWSVSKGLTWGLWRATFGAVRGLVWDLPKAYFLGVYNVTTASLDYINDMAELWISCEDKPQCKDDLLNTVVDKIIDTYQQAPELLTTTAAQLKQQVDQALTSHFSKLYADWKAGDWRDALTDITAEGTDTAVNVAMLLGPAILARSPKAAAAWEALQTATYSKVGNALAKTVRLLEPVKAAVLALSKVVKPGYWFTEEQMASIFGVSERESSLLSGFTKRLGISVVLRSRASQAIKYLEEGLAVVKPYWIKTKNVNELDIKFLGYTDSELGRVVFRKPISSATAEARMRAAGVEPSDVEWKEVLNRLKTRTKEYHGEFKEMQKWNKAGKVKGKWPWAENGVNPAVQADEYKSVRFRLNTGGGAVIPEVFVGGKWKFITGDIDLIAITKSDGSALSDTEHVNILNQLKTILGAQHPESATWINDGKFWFKAKKNYLTNDGECCLAQYGPDGKIRAVEFNEKLSDATNWSKLKYRIFWNGGYQAGPGGG